MATAAPGIFHSFIEELMEVSSDDRSDFSCAGQAIANPNKTVKAHIRRQRHDRFFISAPECKQPDDCKIICHLKDGKEIAINNHTARFSLPSPRHASPH